MATRKALPRFFIDPKCIDLVTGLVHVDEAGLSHQVRNVLRLSEGDRALLLDGLGNSFPASLSSSGRTFIEFRLEPGGDGTKVSQAVSAQPGNSLFRLHSCLPLIKAQRFEWALEKLCELGTHKILPFQSERCVVKLKEKEEGRSKRWQTICREASEQCERLLLPEINEPLALADLLDRLSNSSAGGGSEKIKLLLSERSEKAPDMVSALYNRPSGAGSTAEPLDLFVLGGPEGGFSESEVELILKHGFEPVSLGSMILRSETACILAAGLVSSLNTRKTKEN